MNILAHALSSQWFFDSIMSILSTIFLKPFLTCFSCTVHKSAIQCLVAVAAAVVVASAAVAAAFVVAVVASVVVALVVASIVAASIVVASVVAAAVVSVL